MFSVGVMPYVLCMGNALCFEKVMPYVLCRVLPYVLSA